MDEHKEKAEEDKFQESSEQQPPQKKEAEEEDSSEESMDQPHQERYKEARNAEEEPAAVQLIKEVEAGSEEAASSPTLLGVFANPCSLLQYLLRAFAGWCWAPLHGAFDKDGPKPQQAVAPEAVAPVYSTEQGDVAGEKQADNYFYIQEVVTRMWAVRRGRPPPGAPGNPRQGRGGNGGIHN